MANRFQTFTSAPLILTPRTVALYKSLAPFLLPTILLIVLLSVGTTGFMLIEDWGFLQGLYMTVITISTVGFGEINRLGTDGRIFTMFLIFGGVVFYGVTVNQLVGVILQRKMITLFQDERMKEQIKALRDHYIVCGGGRMGRIIGMELSKLERPFVIIENDETKLKHIREMGWLYLFEDALEEETLIKAGVKGARGLACCLSGDANNLFVVLSARGLKPDIWIETRIDEESTKAKMFQAGANKITYMHALGGMQMARSLVNPDVDDVIVLDLGTRSYMLEILTEVPGPTYVGRTIGEFAVERAAHILAVHNPGTGVHMNFQADIRIEQGTEVAYMRRINT